MNPCCVEAQRHGEELGALDCAAHADHIAAMHEQLKCSCNYDRKGDVCLWHAGIVDAARQQARREAFEEVKAKCAKLACVRCDSGASRPTRSGTGAYDHTYPDGGRATCDAAAIRALAEGER